jgi:hypothetical protein
MMNGSMDKDEIKKAILVRLYDGAFKDDIDYLVKLDEFASENGIERGLMGRIYEELEAEGFFGTICAGMAVEPSVKALIYCEKHQIVDKALIEKQNDIRRSILEACADIYEEEPGDPHSWGDDICNRAHIRSQDFSNNIKILEYVDFIKQDGPFDDWLITLKGRDTVKDLRRKRNRLKEFEKLKDLIDITPQARGHKLEDLLGEVLREEGLEVNMRVQPEGMEHDIVFNEGSNYFLVSCKWEKKPIQPVEADILSTRAHEMACSAGILVSLSGFTSNCVKKALTKRAIKEIVLYGPKDVGTVFSNENKFMTLLNEKVKRLKLMNQILVDGNIVE